MHSQRRVITPDGERRYAREAAAAVARAVYTSVAAPGESAGGRGASEEAAAEDARATTAAILCVAAAGRLAFATFKQMKEAWNMFAMATDGHWLEVVAATDDEGTAAVAAAAAVSSGGPMAARAALVVDHLQLLPPLVWDDDADRAWLEETYGAGRLDTPEGAREALLDAVRGRVGLPAAAAPADASSSSSSSPADAAPATAAAAAAPAAPTLSSSARRRSQALACAALAALARAHFIPPPANGARLDAACRTWVAQLSRSVDDATKDTLLHLAARSGLVGVAFALLRAGARTDVFNRAGRAPLHDAVVACQPGVVALWGLLRVADISRALRTEEVDGGPGRTAWHLMVEVAIDRRRQRRREEQQGQDDGGEGGACYEPAESSADLPDLFKALSLGAGAGGGSDFASLDVRAGALGTPLELALRARVYDACTFLLLKTPLPGKTRLSIDSPDARGLSLLQVALKTGDWDAVGVLVHAGAAFTAPAPAADAAAATTAATDPLALSPDDPIVLLFASTWCYRSAFSEQPGQIEKTLRRMRLRDELLSKIMAERREDVARRVRPDCRLHEPLRRTFFHASVHAYITTALAATTEVRVGLPAAQMEEIKTLLLRPLQMLLELGADARAADAQGGTPALSASQMLGQVLAVGVELKSPLFVDGGPRWEALSDCLPLRLTKALTCLLISYGVKVDLFGPEDPENGPTLAQLAEMAVVVRRAAAVTAEARPGGAAHADPDPDPEAQARAAAEAERVAAELLAAEEKEKEEARRQKEKTEKKKKRKKKERQRAVGGRDGADADVSSGSRDQGDAPERADEAQAVVEPTPSPSLAADDGPREDPPPPLPPPPLPPPPLPPPPPPSPPAPPNPGPPPAPEPTHAPRVTPDGEHRGAPEAAASSDAAAAAAAEARALPAPNAAAEGSSGGEGGEDSGTSSGGGDGGGGGDRPDPVPSTHAEMNELMERRSLLARAQRLNQDGATVDGGDGGGGGGGGGCLLSPEDERFGLGFSELAMHMPWTTDPTTREPIFKQQRRWDWFAMLTRNRWFREAERDIGAGRPVVSPENLIEAGTVGAGSVVARCEIVFSQLLLYPQLELDDGDVAWLENTYGRNRRLDSLEGANEALLEAVRGCGGGGGASSSSPDETTASESFPVAERVWHRRSHALACAALGSCAYFLFPNPGATVRQSEEQPDVKPDARRWIAFLSRPVDESTKDSMLHVAARNGQVGVAFALLRAGARSACLNRAGRSPLHEAVAAWQPGVASLWPILGLTDQLALRTHDDDETGLTPWHVMVETALARQGGSSGGDPAAAVSGTPQRPSSGGGGRGGKKKNSNKGGGKRPPSGGASNSACFDPHVPEGGIYDMLCALRPQGKERKVGERYCIDSLGVKGGADTSTPLDEALRARHYGLCHALLPHTPAPGKGRVSLEQMDAQGRTVLQASLAARDWKLARHLILAGARLFRQGASRGGGGAAVPDSLKPDDPIVLSCTLGWGESAFAFGPPWPNQQHWQLEETLRARKDALKALFARPDGAACARKNVRLDEPRRRTLLHALVCNVLAAAAEHDAPPPVPDNEFSRQLALATGFLGFLPLLIDAGADPDAPDADGLSPLREVRNALLSLQLPDETARAFVGVPVVRGEEESAGVVGGGGAEAGPSTSSWSPSYDPDLDCRWLLGMVNAPQCGKGLLQLKLWRDAYRLLALGSRDPAVASAAKARAAAEATWNEDLQLERERQNIANAAAEVQNADASSTADHATLAWHKQQLAEGAVKVLAAEAEEVAAQLLAEEEAARQREARAAARSRAKAARAARAVAAERDDNEEEEEEAEREEEAAAVEETAPTPPSSAAAAAASISTPNRRLPPHLQLAAARRAAASAAAASGSGSAGAAAAASSSSSRAAAADNGDDDSEDDDEGCFVCLSAPRSVLLPCCNRAVMCAGCFPAVQARFAPDAAPGHAYCPVCRAVVATAAAAAPSR